jgi:hypothetical protein
MIVEGLDLINLKAPRAQSALPLMLGNFEKYQSRIFIRPAAEVRQLPPDRLVTDAVNDEMTATFMSGPAQSILYKRRRVARDQSLAQILKGAAAGGTQTLCTGLRADVVAKRKRSGVQANGKSSG